MIVPNNPALDVAALERRVALTAERLRVVAGSAAAPSLCERVEELGARLALVAELLEAADARTRRAIEHNVSRAGGARLPALVERVYDRVFARQREIAADQNEALVAALHALRELAAVQRTLAEIAAPADGSAHAPAS